MLPSNSLSSRTRRLLSELDWDCSDQSHLQSSLNILHWYPASFITAIPGNLIDVFSDAGDTVWDPFCGSGITAVECYKKDRNFIGNDICSLSVLIAQGKINLLSNKDNFIQHIAQFTGHISNECILAKFCGNTSLKHDYCALIERISYDDLKHWYNPLTLQKLLQLKIAIDSYHSPSDLKLIYYLIFLNIARLSCAQQKTWGHIADNVRPNKQQLDENNIDPLLCYIKRLKMITQRLSRNVVFPTKCKISLTHADSRIFFPQTNVDLIITSPPYPSMCDYISSQRISYYWLGCTHADIIDLKKEEIGARFLRHNPKKNIYYFENMQKSFDNIARYLRPEGIMCLLLPAFNEDDARQKYIDKFYSYLTSNFELIYSTFRSIDKLNRWAPFRRLKTEKLTIWRRYVS